MDKCDLKGLQYVYLVQNLKRKFYCQVFIIDEINNIYYKNKIFLV